LGKKARFDSLGNPVKGEDAPAVTIFKPSPDDEKPISLVVQRAQEGDRGVGSTEVQVTDEENYQQLFGMPKLTTAEYLDALKHLSEEKRREAWNNLTPNQRLELRNIASGKAAPALVSTIPSSYWLLPLVLGLVGGVIAWAIVKEKDAKKAQNMLIFGVVWGFSLGLVIWAGALAYTNYQLGALTGGGSVRNGEYYGTCYSGPTSYCYQKSDGGYVCASNLPNDGRTWLPNSSGQCP